MFTFPSWSNRVPWAVVAVSGLAGLLVSLVVYYWATPKHTDVGYSPTQPIPFSHRVHAGDLGMDCRFCHHEVERSGHANIPSADLCMNCHKSVKADSPAIKQLALHAASNVATPWVQVHKLPDYARFNHSVHVAKGVACASCHGRIDQMDQVRQTQPLSMAFCLDCHKHPESARVPVKDVTRMPSRPGSETKPLPQAPSLDCAVCHH